mmetsp:Transcript_9446/g.17742  ORF Transcript_9446/g.17742 Transcript_9446/m.17742 type:complete len:205 (+) Transcript_9446:220-834(+)
MNTDDWVTLSLSTDTTRIVVHFPSRIAVNIHFLLQHKILAILGRPALAALFGAKQHPLDHRNRHPVVRPELVVPDQVRFIFPRRAGDPAPHAPKQTGRSFDELALGVGIRGLLLGRAAQLGGGLLVQRQGVVDDGDAGVVVGGKAHGARGEREHHVLELHVELAAPPRAAPNGVDGQVQALQDGHQLAARQHLGLEADGVAQRC